MTASPAKNHQILRKCNLHVVVSEQRVFNRLGLHIKKTDCGALVHTSYHKFSTTMTIKKQRQNSFDPAIPGQVGSILGHDLLGVSNSNVVFSICATTKAYHMMISPLPFPP